MQAKNKGGVMQEDMNSKFAMRAAVVSKGRIVDMACAVILVVGSIIVCW